MNYDTNIFNKFRELAITDMDDLVTDQTYYTNFDNTTHTVKGFVTNDEHYNSLGLKWREPETANDMDWLETVEGEVMALVSYNVGGSHNPWLIFETEELAKACRAELIVTFEPDPYDYDFYNEYDEDDYYDADDVCI